MYERKRGMEKLSHYEFIQQIWLCSFLEHNICSVAVNSSAVHLTFKYNVPVTSFMLLYLETVK